MMFTRSFHALMSAMPQSSSVVCGTAPLTDVYGMQYFHSNQFTFPNSRVEAFATGGEFAAGISFGSGTTAPKDTDFNLASAIEPSRLSVTIGSRDLSANSGGTSITYVMSVMNVSSDGADVTIGEMCYKQNARGTLYQGATAAQDIVVMIDRTLVSPAVTLAFGETCTISYTLRTLPGEETVDGVKIVSWQLGSDEDVAAMIDAAHEGTIDLSDYWGVGDMRPCAIGQWTDGSMTVRGNEALDLVITSFEDYESCGCVMQVDFAEGPTVRMDQADGNSGGYARTEMRTTTLPAYASALPSWIQERMVEFDVKASAGGQGTASTTVSGNLMALRSEYEVSGTTNNSYPDEGTRIQWYQNVAKKRQKRNGRAGGNTAWRLRSPARNTTNFALMNADGGSSTSNSNLNSYVLVPFFCM